MKALSTTMTIVVTIIVILIAALVILTVFSGGIDKTAEQFNKWFDWIYQQPTPNVPGASNTVDTASCQAQCTLYCGSTGASPGASFKWGSVNAACKGVEGLQDKCYC